MPDELVQRFCEETLDQIRELSADILRIEKNANPESVFEAILRSLHSMKGSARMLGLTELSQLIHAAEDFFSFAASYPEHITSDTIDQFLATADAIEDAITAVFEHSDAPDFGKLLETIHSYQIGLQKNEAAGLEEFSRHEPEIFQSLTPQQSEEFLASYKTFQHLYVLELSFSRMSFSADVRSVHTLLKNSGKLIATTGTTDAPEKGYDLKFLFLQLSNTGQQKLQALFGKYAPKLREVPMPHQTEAPPESESVQQPETPPEPVQQPVVPSPANKPQPEVEQERPIAVAPPVPETPPSADTPRGPVDIQLLAQYVPEAHEVLAPQQIDMLVQYYNEYRNLYAIELSFRRDTFSRDVRAVNKLLSTDGKLVSTTGTTKAPAPGYDLKFLFLLLTNADTERIEDITQQHVPVVSLVPSLIKAEGKEIPATQNAPTPGTLQANQERLAPVLSYGREQELAYYGKYAPEIFQVLGSNQIDQFFNTLSHFTYAYIIDLCFHRDQFTQKVRDVTAMMNEKGLLISTTGTSQRPAEGFNLRFLFLFLSNEPAQSLAKMFRDYAPQVTALPKQGERASASTQKETPADESATPATKSNVPQRVVPQERVQPEPQMPRASIPTAPEPSQAIPPAAAAHVKQSAPVTREIRKGSPLESERKKQLQEFARQAPEVLSVLTPQQEDTLLGRYKEYAFIYLLELSFKRSTFANDIREISTLLSSTGLLLSSTGTGNPPASGFDLRFVFFFLTNSNTNELASLTQAFAPFITEIHPPASETTSSQAERPAIEKPIVSTPKPEPRVEQPVPKQTPAPVQSPAPEAAPKPKAKPKEKKLRYDDDFAKLQEWFLDEGEEILKRLNADILSLEKEGDPEIIHSIFRSFHNLKGSGGSYNFPYVSRVAHLMESFVQPYRSSVSPPDSTAIDKMLRGVDMLSYVFSVCKEGGHNSLEITKLEDQLRAILTGEEPAAKPAAEESAAPPKEQQPSESSQEQQPETSAPAPTEEPASPSAETKAPAQKKPREKAGQSRTPDSIRVNLRKLDSIVSTAVELSVAHTAEQKLLIQLTEALEEHNRLINEWKSIEEKLRRSRTQGNGKVFAITDIHSKTLSQFQQRLREIFTQLESGSFRRSNLASELGDDALQLQLQPLSTLFDSFQRIVRDLSKTLGKPSDLEIDDQYVEVDRRIIEALKDPFTHLLRNAIDHGIEPPETRRANNKPERGKISVTARQLGFSFVINISDDGYGIDKDALMKSIVAKGLATAEELEHLHEADLYSYLFKPGFSTQSRVTDISGRGVGLDVVETNVRQIGGEVQVYSEFGKGTTFSIHLPTNLTLSRALLLEVHDFTFSFPVAITERVLALPPSAVEKRNGMLLTAYEDTFIPVVEIERLLGMERSTLRMRNGLIIKKRDTLLCLSVPRIVDETELITKPLPPHLRSNRFVSGVNVLSDGRLALVLNPAIVQPPARQLAEDEDSLRRTKRRLLVVDDSLIARELLSNILLAFDYDVSLARDGKEAMQFLKMHVVDLIISDVDMPNMNGYTLTRTLKADPEFSKIPIVIITAKESNMDRMEGLEVGADEYLFKGSFNQQNLIDTVEQLLEKTSV